MCDLFRTLINIFIHKLSTVASIFKMLNIFKKFFSVFFPYTAEIQGMQYLTDFYILPSFIFGPPNFHKK